MPTMGALHDGHISLIQKSIAQKEFTVCSIFVNPHQFNDKSDFEKYPKRVENDILLLESAGCDMVFLPEASELYGIHYRQPFYELGKLENIFEGRYRPGHFQGVCAVIDRLVEIIKPSAIYLGKKDFQQCKVIAELFRLKGWKNKIKIVVSETVREKNGLALSSRNLRLSKQGIHKAGNLFKALQEAKEILLNADEGVEFYQLKNKMTRFLFNNGFEKVDYFELVDNDFNVVPVFNKTTGKNILITAASIEGIRLIDNLDIVS